MILSVYLVLLKSVDPFWHTDNHIYLFEEISILLFSYSWRFEEKSQPKYTEHQEYEEFNCLNKICNVNKSSQNCRP